MRKLVLVVSSFSILSSGWSYDAFRDELARPTAAKQDVDKLTRPVRGPLKTAEIKDFRDRIAAVQSRLFKDGPLPKGVTLRAEGKTSADSFRVETPFNQLSKEAQAQVVSKMPEAKTAVVPLVLKVALTNGVARIESVKTAPPPLSAPSVSARAGVPGSVKPSKDEIASPLKTELRNESVSQAPANTFRAESDRPTTRLTLPEAAKTLIGKDNTVVQVLDNPIVFSNDGTTRVLVPSASKEPIVVERVESNPAGMGILVTVTAPGVSMPAMIVERLTEEHPEALSMLSSDERLTMVVGLKPDATFSVESIRPAVTQAEPGEVAAPFVEVTTFLASVQNAMPSDPKVASVSSAAFLKGAQQFATAVGLDSQALTLETPSVTPLARPSDGLAVVTLSNQSAVLVQPTVTPNSVTVYRVQGRLGSLSNTLQAEIRARLGTSSTLDFLAGNPELVVESKMDDQNSLNIISIALPASDQSSPPILLWKLEPARTARSENAASKPVLRSQPLRVVGLAPAAWTVVKGAFGERARPLSFQNLKGEGRLQMSLPGGAPTTLRWQHSERADQQGFLFVGKPVEFTDSIRAAIEAELAKRPTDRPVTDFEVALIVDQSRETPELRVKEVGPSPRDVAIEQAEKIGLAANDYLLVDLGGRFLIVVDAGQSADLTHADETVRFKSPDGQLMVVVNPRQLKADDGALLLMSRAALKTNWATLVRVAGETIDGVMETAMKDNPRTQQFLVRIGPSADAAEFIIRPMDPAGTTFMASRRVKP
jgi:hypothetical protein